MATKDQVLKLHAEGLSNMAIAERLGCKDGYVRATIARANGYKPPRRTYIGAAERAERAIDQRDLDILCDVKEGHSRRQIAKHWGVSESFVGRLVEAARAAE